MAGVLNLGPSSLYKIPPTLSVSVGSKCKGDGHLLWSVLGQHVTWCDCGGHFSWKKRDEYRGMIRYGDSLGVIRENHYISLLGLP